MSQREQHKQYQHPLVQTASGNGRTRDPPEAGLPQFSALYGAIDAVSSHLSFPTISCNPSKKVNSMERKKLSPAEYVLPVLEALPKGILLTTKTDNKVNSMVIGWGTLGFDWSTPVFVAFVREGRFTRRLLDENPEFSINVPSGPFDRRIIAVCGGTSGRDTDKITAAGLTLVAPDRITVPAIRELPLTLECRVIYRQKQELSLLDQKFLPRFYPAEVDGSHVGANRDAHIAYYGEIVSAYLLQ